MSDGMPQLVDAFSPPPLAHSYSHPSAGATPWAGGRGVLPGGFGTGTPHPLQRQMTDGTPARTQISFPQSPTFANAGFGGHPGERQLNPMLAPENISAAYANGAGAGAGAGASPAGSGGFDPFSIPAAAFDQARGFQYPPAAAAPSAPGGPWNMPSPFHASTPHPQPNRQDGFDDDDDVPPGWFGPTYDDRPREAWPAEWGAQFSQPSPGSSSGVGAGAHTPPVSAINGFASGPRSQYKRPENWREGFSMSRPSSLTRVFSFGKGGLFSRQPSVHRILDAKERMCSWDIRRPPEHFLVLPEQRSLTFLELQEGAMTPAPFRMKITHPMLPWTIHITASPSSAPGPSQSIITIGHLVASLHAELMRPIFHADFWNDEVSEEDRKKIHAAWAKRCNGDRAVAQQGIKRIDFLCDRWVFEGLRRVGDCWQMKLKSGRRHM